MKRKETGLDAGAVTLLQLFKGEREYISPLFQRRFVWGVAEIDSLWDGVDNILQGEDSERFLGALVLEVKSAGMAFRPDSAWIVDGQQRLTTLYLTLILLARHARDAGKTELSNTLFEQYVLNQGGQYKNRPKLQPTLVDFTQFNHLFSDIGSIEPKLAANFGESTGAMTDAAKRTESHIRQRCYVDKVFDEEIAVKIVTTLLEKLAFVQIILGDEHNAHQVFDSLNSKGIRLENRDLIRNLVFQKLADSPEQAQQLYQKSWVPLEESLGDRFDGYFFPFALVDKPTATKSNLLAALKDRWQTKAAFEIIEDLKVHVSTYNALTAREGKPWSNLTTSDAINNRMRVLNRMKTPASVFPFIFRLIRAFNSDALTEGWGVANLLLIESFLVRRAFAGFEPTGLHVVFKDLWHATQGDPAKFISTIDDKATVRFPDDQTFKTDVATRPLYGRKLAMFIIREYEHGLDGGDLLPEDVAFSLDHVIPNEITSEWLEEISQEDHLQLRHVWGNLVPLTIKANSEKARKNWLACRAFSNRNHF